MDKLRGNQYGFGAIEVLLIVVIVGILGFTGWYVWGAKNNADKSLSSNHSTSPVIKKNTVKTATTPSTAASTTSPSSNGGTIKIPELGIEIINIPSSISDLTEYQYAADTGVDSNNTITTPVKFVSVQFSTQSLTNADPNCSAKDGSSIGVLTRTDGTYVNNGPKDNTAFVKQFNGFYVTYSHPESACSNNASTEALHGSQTTTFQTLVTNAANLQAL